MSSTRAFAPDVPVRTVDVLGTPVAMRRKGEGEPLLFLHGGGFTGRWLRFHEALAARADVLAPEHPGFGTTPRQEWLEEIEDFALYVDALRIALGLEAVDLVGYSLGGWGAATYAAFHPDRVRSLALVAPVGMPTASGSTGVDLFAVEPPDLFGTLFHDLTNAGEVAIDPGDDEAMTRSYEDLITLARLMWHRRVDQKLPFRLRRVTCPTLVVAGEEDVVVPLERCQAYVEAIAGAQLERVAGAGHALIVEQPAEVAQTILDFVEDAR